jgi:xylulokinase
MGVMLAAGGSLRWFRDAVCPAEKARAVAEGKDPYDVILAGAESIAPGCEGLLFLPYLSGERTPHADPLARGAFVGLTFRHSKAHMARAVLEGVAFGLRDSLELVRNSSGGEVRQLRASGGGIRSRLWRQILADVLGTELETLRITEGAAYGAALLAGVGAGCWKSVGEACRTAIRLGERVATDPQFAEGYHRSYLAYRELYTALRPTFRHL